MIQKDLQISNYSSFIEVGTARADICNKAEQIIWKIKSTLDSKASSVLLLY